MSKTHQVKVSVPILDFDKKTVTKPKQYKNRKICGSFSLHLLKKSSMKNFIFYLLKDALSPKSFIFHKFVFSMKIHPSIISEIIKTVLKLNIVFTLVNVFNLKVLKRIICQST